MGQLVTTVVGGIAGFAIGGPFGAQVGMMLGGMIGATLFGPTVHGPRLNDLKVSASTYGVAIPEIYGTVRVGGNLIWTSGIRETKKTSRAGKGGPKQTTYSYDATFAMGLCKGPIDGILRIWADSKLIYDVSGGATRRPTTQDVFTTIFISLLTPKKKSKRIRVRVYNGTEEQLPDSLIEAKEGVGNVSGHRGLAYVVFERLALEDFGNRIPQLTFEVTKSITKSTQAITVKDETGDDEITSNRRWLPDFDSGRILSFAVPASATRLYNFADMKLMASSSAMAFNPIDNSISMITGDNLLLVANYPAGVGFSYYNTATLTQVSQHNSAGGVDNQFNPTTQAVTLSTTGRIGHGRFVSGEASGRHILHVDWRGVAFLMDQEGRLLSRFNAPFSPAVLLEGKRNNTSSQIIGWRSANNRLELFTVTTPGSAQYTTITDGVGTTWVPYSDYTLTSVNLQPMPGDKFRPLVVLYDPTDDHIFCLGIDPDKYSTEGFSFGGDVVVFKYSLATGTYKFIQEHQGVYPPNDTTLNMRYSRLAGGSFSWVDKPRLAAPAQPQIDLQSGALISHRTTNDDLGGSLGLEGDQFWDDETDSLFVSRFVNGQPISYRLATFESVTSITIPGIIEDICLRSGVLTPDDIDVSELTDAGIVGYAMDRVTTARDALKQMATAFLFDAYESDYKLKFRSRGGDTILNIPEDWLVRSGNEGVIRESITQELEMPLRMTVNYYDVARDYQQGTQTAKRKSGPFPTMWTAKEDVVELPISWDADSAKQCAEKLLKTAWANRIGHQFSLPWRYLKYDPTDVIDITMENGTVYNLRLTEANIGSDFKIEASAVSESATAYVSNAVGSVSEAPPQTLDGDGSAFPIVINTPLIRDVDFNTTGLSVCYISAGTNEVSFNGTVVYMDNGIDYQAIGVISGQTTSGYTATALPPTKAYESTDETTVLRVRLSDPSMELESVTQDDMLNFDANAALVGDEIIQFRDAELLPSGEWALTGLLRARRGTNYAVNGHKTGELFLMLDTNSTGKFTRPPESYVTTRAFKAAPFSVSLADVFPTTYSLVPRDLMPYTPEDVKISDDDVDVTISTQRRSRVTAPLRDGSGIIHYKEGDMLSARMIFNVWIGKGLNDVTTVADPDKSFTEMLFNAAGEDLPLEITFPVADLGMEDTILVQIFEVGEVDGIPKWVEAIRLGENLWNVTELY